MGDIDYRELEYAAHAEAATHMTESQLQDAAAAARQAGNENAARAYDVELESDRREDEDEDVEEAPVEHDREPTAQETRDQLKQQQEHQDRLQRQQEHQDRLRRQQQQQPPQTSDDAPTSPPE